MYKKTADKLASLERSASHATKGFADGTWIGEMPGLMPQELEETYNSVKLQRDLLVENLSVIRAKSEPIRHRLSHSISRDDAMRAKASLQRLNDAQHDVEQELAKIREVVRLAGQNAWGAVYWKVCCLLLPQNIVFMIDDAVGEILERTPTEGVSPKRTIERNRVVSEKTKLNDRRKIFAAKLQATTGIDRGPALPVRLSRRPPRARGGSR